MSLLSYDEQGNDRSIDESSFSGIPMSATTHVYWLNTGADDDTSSNQTTNVHFMRATFATKCRASQIDRFEHCPRAGKGIHS